MARILKQLPKLIRQHLKVGNQITRVKASTMKKQLHRKHSEATVSFTLHLLNPSRETDNSTHYTGYQVGGLYSWPKCVNWYPVLRICYRIHLQSPVIQNVTKLTATTFNARTSVYVQNSKLCVNSHHHFDVCRKTINSKLYTTLQHSGFCFVCLKPFKQIHSFDFIKQIFRNVQICYQYISKSLT